MTEEEEKRDIEYLLDSQGIIFFFEKDKEYFGTGEEGRMIFARMKNPDDDTSEEANFTAQNLSKMIAGEPSQHVFSLEDLNKINVVSKDDVVKKLKTVSDDTGERFDSIKIIKIGRLMPKGDTTDFTLDDEE